MTPSGVILIEEYIAGKNLVREKKILFRYFRLAWPGLGWAGLAWTGLAWAGLDWPGLAWASLGWPRLASVGFAQAGCKKRAQAKPAWPGLGSSFQQKKTSHNRVRHGWQNWAALGLLAFSGLVRAASS